MSKRIETSDENEIRNWNWLNIGINLTIYVAMSVTSIYLAQWIEQRLTEYNQAETEQDHPPPSKFIQKRLSKILEKRGFPMTAIPSLTSYERQMADDIVDPDDIEISFKDVGGLDDTKREIYELAVMPLLKPELFRGNLVRPCKGILLYGKPGTGKTMIAKCLAKESKSIFLPLQLSKILNKYWGESNKLIAATFSLANKLQPAIIFVDELDTFLKNTSEQTAYMDSIKAEFLTLWDGIGTSSTSRVLVLGATNKPSHIDSAILRRMPRAFEIPLPGKEGRLAILKLFTDDENLELDARRNLEQIATLTVGYSGSDLKEVCKAAAMVGIRERTSEFAKLRVMGGNTTTLEELALESELRPISLNDFYIALGKIKRSGEVANQYGTSQAQEERRNTEDSASSAEGKILRHILSLIHHQASTLSTDDVNYNDIPDLK